MWKIKINNKIAFISIGSVLLMSTLFMYGDFTMYKISMKKEQEGMLRASLIQSAQKNHFKDIAVEAEAIYVYDVSTQKVLYQKNANKAFPLASVTKAMTAIIAKDEGEDENIITIDQNAILTDGDSGLQEGERWTLKKLLSFMLISSSNDGAAAISGAFPNFVDKMNQKATVLGLDTMKFKNPTGLDMEESNETGGYGSAKDVAELFEYGVRKYPELFEPTTYLSKEFSSDLFQHEARNTNAALTDIPNSLASKTGYTNKAGGNLAMVFDRGLSEPVIVVVLGSSYDGRFKDMENLALAALKTYNQPQ